MPSAADVAAAYQAGPGGAVLAGRFLDAVLAHLPTGDHVVPSIDGDEEGIISSAAYTAAAGQRQRHWRMASERSPVLLSRGRYFITRRADVLAALRNSKVFESARRLTFTGFGVEQIPTNYVGARHARYRRILDPAFGPRAVAPIERKLREHAAALVDAVTARGQCEAGDLADPFAAQGLLSMLGFPPADWKLVLGLVGQVLDNESPDHYKLPAKQRLLDYVSAILARRPRRGVSGHLLGDGKCPFDGKELLGFFSFALIVGIGSVEATIGFALLELARDPQLRARLCDDPALIPAFVDEILRVESPIPTIQRVTSEDVTVGSFTVPASSRVLLFLAAVNTEDSAKVELPEDARIRKRHWAFGGGPYRCLGSHLARMELRVFLEEWLKKIPDFELAPGFTPRIVEAEVDRLASLPLRWDK